MNHRHRDTLSHIFKTPIDRSLDWWKVEHMFEALGAELIESGTSRVKVRLHGEECIFSRPHHRHESNIRVIKAVRQFLERVHITPKIIEDSDSKK